MGYIKLAIISLVTYSFVPPLVKIITQRVTPQATLILMDVISATIIFIWSQSKGKGVGSVCWKDVILILITSMLLTVSLLSYYKALSVGRLSVVVPIYGMFVVFSSIFGCLLFSETLSLTKILGLLLAIGAVILMSI